jgi:hypothetical protein
LVLIPTAEDAEIAEPMLIVLCDLWVLSGEGFFRGINPVV